MPGGTPKAAEQPTAEADSICLAHPVAVRYSSLPNHIREALATIEPNRNADLLLYPCRAVLGTGEVFENVYIVPEEPYLRYWGIYPENDQGRH